MTIDFEELDRIIKEAREAGSLPVAGTISSAVPLLQTGQSPRYIATVFQNMAKFLRGTGTSMVEGAKFFDRAADVVCPALKEPS